MERNANRPAQGQFETLINNGFTEDEVERLFMTRTRCEEGQYSEDTRESKRLQFARWLYQRGKIES